MYWILMLLCINVFLSNIVFVIVHFNIDVGVVCAKYIWSTSQFYVLNLIWTLDMSYLFGMCIIAIISFFIFNMDLESQQRARGQNKHYGTTEEDRASLGMAKPEPTPVSDPISPWSGLFSYSWRARRGLWWGGDFLWGIRGRAVLVNPCPPSPALIKNYLYVPIFIYIQVFSHCQIKINKIILSQL